jgi:hypothetical protein
LKKYKNFKLINSIITYKKMTDIDDKEQPIPFLVYDSNTKGKYHFKIIFIIIE